MEGKIYKILPVFEERIWGTQELRERYGYETDLNNIAEVYNVVAAGTSGQRGGGDGNAPVGILPQKQGAVRMQPGGYAGYDLHGPFQQLPVHSTPSGRPLRWPIPACGDGPKAG